jgi:hypothetical protein
MMRCQQNIKNGNKVSVSVKGRIFLSYLTREIYFTSASPHGGRRLTVMQQKKSVTAQ